jgi:hypothetical protein
MADTDNKWGVHIDKIAYGVAGLLGIALLLVPVLLGGQINDIALLAEKDKLVERIRREGEMAREPVQVPDLAAEIVKQWEPGPASAADPRWATERAQVLLRVVPKTKPPNAVHLPPEIQEVSCQRDPAKKAVYLVVKGIANPANYLVEITKVELLRQEGAEGKLAPVKGFSAKGDFEYRDDDVTAGKTYTYKVVTHAQRDPKAQPNVEFDPATQAKQESAPLGPTEPVPYDWSLWITTIDPPDPGAGQPPRFMARFRYWDYKEGKMVDYKSGQSVPFVESVPVAGFDFFPVDAGSQTVTVRPPGKKGLVVKKSRAHLPVDLWAKPLTAAPAPETVKEEASEAEAAPKVKGATAKEATPKKATTAKGTTTKDKSTSSTKKKSEAKSKSSSEGTGKKSTKTKKKFE